MDNSDNFDSQDEPKPRQPLIDDYDNIHFPTDELARGGQGVVFRTADVDLAIKQPLDKFGNPDKKNTKLRDQFQNIRYLPLPSRIPISLPLAILRDEPGYVMRLLNGLMPFEVFDLDGMAMRKLREEMTEKAQELPKWMSTIPDKDLALRLFHYAQTGSTRRRLSALSRCASILSRLHSAGLVYGDISPKNVFIGDGDFPEVWLIDADNLRFERRVGGSAVYTPHYGAPEIVQRLDQTRPQTDCWAFAVMAFRALVLCHPFIGKRVLELGDDEGGWDSEPVTEDAPTDLDEQAYAGYLPFIDDASDASNAAVTGLPRELVATPALLRIFQETLGVGRTQPHRRPGMAFWALELARACDQSLTCPECAMSYFADMHEECPYCDAQPPPFIRAKTPRWEVLIPVNATTFALRHRLFNPFSPAHNDDKAYEAVLDFAKGSVLPVRGTRPFPSELSFEFVGAGK